MKKAREFFISALLVCTAASVWANPQNAKELVNEKYFDELVKNEVVTVMKDDASNSLELLPKSEYAEKLKGNIIKKADGNYPFTYESLYFKSKADLLKTSNSTADSFDISDISRICRSVSKMEGMTYMSSSKKKEVVLYDKAYMTDGVKGPKIADLNTGNADGQVSYCMQNDNTFGECNYRLNYYQSEKEMMAVFTNTTVVGLGPFKAIYPDLMRINILVIDLGEDILFYICCDLDSVKFPGIKNQITDSMTSRMNAVYNWFIKQF